MDLDLVRLIPTRKFGGLPTAGHRPYAFYADAQSLIGLTIAECYRTVRGLNLPASRREELTPFSWRNIEPINLTFSLELDDLMREDFSVLRVDRAAALRELDAFPATWRSVAYISSDPERICQNLEPAKSRAIHQRFKEILAENGQSPLQARGPKEFFNLQDLDRTGNREEELPYYQYISYNSGFADEIVDLFGISCRCWHGCGYLGPEEAPVCRFYLLQNKICPALRVTAMRGSEVLKLHQSGATVK